MPKKLITKIEQTKEYQIAWVFLAWFRSSKPLLEFRVAWKIPPTGFSSQKEQKVWEEGLFKQTNLWLASDKYLKYLKQRDIKHIEAAQGKISWSDFQIFARSVSLTIPLIKYAADLDNLLLYTELPLYWRNFVERCVFYNEPKICPVNRPAPQTKIEWDNDLQCKTAHIVNIFADTPISDFRSKQFAREYLKLVKTLPGYKIAKTRSKKNFDKYQKAFQLSKDEKGSDYEFGEMLFNSSSEGKKENKNKEKAKKIRQFAKKLRNHP